MNVTREVITDLLPIYFSDEASGDTKALAEDYFRQYPDCERIARSAAGPLETLRAAAPIAASPERKKRDRESVFWGLRRRQWLFGVSLFLTLAPLASALGNGHFVSLMVRDAFWNAFQWSLAAALWFLYFARLRWRTKKLVFAIYFTLIPIPFALHSVFASGPLTTCLDVSRPTRRTFYFDAGSSRLSDTHADSLPDTFHGAAGLSRYIHTQSGMLAGHN